MTTSKIKLSAVICARNDDYGKNLLERAILCLNSMLDSFDEVFYVDWNTVSGKPSLLVDVYPYLTGDTTKLKHVCISPEQHKKFTAKDPFAAPVCEVLGRNVGIRRSSGTWVVSTNIDIIAPPREVLLAFIDNADERTFYTMARRNYDVDYNEWNHKNWKALRLSLGDIAPRQVKPLTEVINGKPSDHGNYSVINYCGDFQLANETLWFDLRGFEERLLRAQFADTNVQKKAMIHGYKLKAIYDIDVFHLNHAQGGGGSKGSNKVAVNDSNSLKTQNRTQNDEHWGLWKQDVPVLDEAALQHNNAQEIFMIGRFRRVRIYLKLRRWLRSLKRLLLYSPIKN